MLKAIGPDVLHDLERAAGLEWLETNGRGGFASSTVTGLNTRRYHSLLTVALDPPVRRHVLLSRVEEVIEDGASKTELGVSYYPGTVTPRGFEKQASFRLDPFPVFTWEIGDRRIEKALFLVDGEDTLVVRYSLLKGAPATLRLRPFVAFRDYHALQHARVPIDPTVRISTTSGSPAAGASPPTLGNVTSIKPLADLPELFFHHSARDLTVKQDWWKSCIYPVEKERGLDFEEDLWSPFELRWELSSRAPILLVVSTSRALKLDPARLEAQERARRSGVVADARRAAPALDDTLALAADAFLVRRGSPSTESAAGATIIAGYPWFTDWGRDTMISLPGLCLSLGRKEEARDILATFARHVDGGMIPNRFPDSGERPEYNNIDGTLWFLHAIGRYVARTSDWTTIETILLPAALEVITRHREGTRHGIRVDTDGLLTGGEAGVQLTWMDAKVGDWVVTPRRGKAVEINALWIEALETTAELCLKLGKARIAAELKDGARLARESFANRFWCDDGFLFDVVDSPDAPEGRAPHLRPAGDGRWNDASLRPNQILAISLPHPALDDAKKARAVVELVEKELVTPFGLRTLSPRDPRYKGVYTGDVYARDAAYHQGTVWPWLLGPFVRAFLRVHGRSPGALADAKRYVSPLLEHLADGGLGQVSEIFDGDPPHAARGCFAQAWSLAELIAITADELRG